MKRISGENTIAKQRYIRLRTFARDMLFKAVIRIILNPLKNIKEQLSIKIYSVERPEKVTFCLWGYFLNILNSKLSFTTRVPEHQRLRPAWNKY